MKTNFEEKIVKANVRLAVPQKCRKFTSLSRGAGMTVGKTR